MYDLHIIFIISCFSSFWLLASLRWRVHFCLHSRSQNKWLNLRILVHEITLWNSCTCFPCYPSTYHPCLLKAFEPGSFTSTSLPKYNALHYLYIPSSPILWWREKNTICYKNLAMFLNFLIFNFKLICFLCFFLNKIILITLKNYCHSILKIFGGGGGVFEKKTRLVI